MKTYIDRGNIIDLDDLSIPKDTSNIRYVQFLEEQARGEATLVPYVPPSPTWTEIRGKREMLLKESDWMAFPDVNHTNKEAWLDYRQALRDIPQNFTNPEDVVWPQKPN